MNQDGKVHHPNEQTVQYGLLHFDVDFPPSFRGIATSGRHVRNSRFALLPLVSFL